MTIKTNMNGDEAQLIVSGCLDTAATVEFNAAVDATEKMVHRFVFDLSDLEFIASSALRTLVALKKRSVAAGGDVRVTAASEAVRDVFDVTGLDTVFGL